MTENRKQTIIAHLEHHWMGSRAERQQAIDTLVRHGYTEQEITDALAEETLRIEAQRDRIKKLQKGLKH